MKRYLPRRHFTGTYVSCLGTSVFAEALWTAPGEVQDQLLLSQLSPAIWTVVAALFTIAISIPRCWDPKVAGMRFSFWVATASYVALAGAATMRAVVWATDPSRRGFWGERSVWSIWLITIGLCVTLVACIAELIQTRHLRSPYSDRDETPGCTTS